MCCIFAMFQFKWCTVLLAVCFRLRMCWFIQSMHQIQCVSLVRCVKISAVVPGSIILHYRQTSKISAQSFEALVSRCVRDVKELIKHNGRMATWQVSMWSIYVVPLSHGKVSGALGPIPCTVRVPCQAAFSTGLPINLTPMQRHLGHTNVWAQVQLLLCR